MHTLNIASVLTKMTIGELRDFICKNDLNLIKKILIAYRNVSKKKHLPSFAMKLAKKTKTDPNSLI